MPALSLSLQYCVSSPCSCCSPVPPASCKTASLSLLGSTWSSSSSSPVLPPPAPPLPPGQPETVDAEPGGRTLAVVQVHPGQVVLLGEPGVWTNAPRHQRCPVPAPHLPVVVGQQLHLLPPGTALCTSCHWPQLCTPQPGSRGAAARGPAVGCVAGRSPRTEASVLPPGTSVRVAAPWGGLKEGGRARPRGLARSRAGRVQVSGRGRCSLCRSSSCRPSPPQNI